MAIHSETNIRRHTGLFCVIDLFYVLAQQMTLNALNKEMPGYGTLNFLIFLSYPFLIVFFVRTIRAPKRVPFARKILPVGCLVMFNFFYIVSINLINPFDRMMTSDDIITGLVKSLILHVCFLLPLSLILALITRTRIIATDDHMDRIHEIN